ncbi:MFS transporter, partial [Acidobacteria bacterium AH-259-D05]|nr:MFS transporter [Acidobacteria bacterium AH-259-D05]
RRWITVGVMMGMFLAALEATAVVTAMPTVISSLGGLELYSWVYSVYFLTATVTVPLWGRLSDLYGRRLFYLAGIGFFVCGSALCGLSQSMVQLIGFRVVQGLGAGALLPLGMTIIGDIYSLERRARMQAWFSGVWGVSSIIGPLVGGMITDYLSWRWVFYLNVPFGLFGAAVIAMALLEPENTRRSRVDYLGAVLLIGSLSFLLIGLDQLGSGESGPLQYILLITSLLLLTLFIFHQRRAADPILPLYLFADRIFSAAALNGFFSGITLFGAISFLPLFVQGVLGTGAMEAGWAITPLMLGWVVFSIIGGRLLLIVGYRILVVSGMSCLMVGAFFLSRVDAAVTTLHLTTMLVLMGVGMGLSMISMLIAVQSRFPRHYLGIATSATQFFRTIGASIGIAIMGSVMARQMLLKMANLNSPEASDQIAYIAHNPDVMVNPLTRGQISPALLEQLQGVLGSVLQDVFFVGFIASLFALASAFMVPRGSARQHARRE